MSETKKDEAKLGQDKMADVKGGIPYEDPGIIPLDGGTVTVTPGTGDDGTITVTPATGEDPTTGNLDVKGCWTGYRDTASCLPGDHAVNACGDGFSVVYN